jgi:3-hydroxybutyryl-CoA dehydratase
MSDLHGLYLEDLVVGQHAVYTKTVGEADIVLYAGISGDTNPVHLDAEFAAATPFKQRIAHGMLSAGFISAVIGTKLPGPGAIYLSQSLRFKAPVCIGDTVVARAQIATIDQARRRVTITTTCEVRGKVVIEGEAMVMVDSRGTAT